MHSAQGLVCNRPEGHLLSCFDPSATQTVSTVCVRRSGMAVQGPLLRAHPVSLCVHEGRRRRPYTLREVGVRILNYLDDWLILVQSREQLGDHRDLVLRHLSQLGLLVNWEKSNLFPCADNLVSRFGVRLGEYYGTPHGGMCPSSAELPEFLQRQECGTTETTVPLQSRRSDCFI